MPNLPTLSTGSVAMYPATISREYGTDMVVHVNDSEQRWSSRAMLFAFQLVYVGVSSYDVNLMREFFNSKKGMLVDAGLSNTFSVSDANINGGTAVNYCYFAQDAFEPTSTSGTKYDFTLQIAQARPN